MTKHLPGEMTAQLRDALPLPVEAIAYCRGVCPRKFQQQRLARLKENIATLPLCPQVGFLRCRLTCRSGQFLRQPRWTTLMCTVANALLMTTILPMPTLLVSLHFPSTRTWFPIVYNPGVEAGPLQSNHAHSR